MKNRTRKAYVTNRRRVGVGRLDPSRTLTLRRSFSADLTRRWKLLRGRIVKAFADDLFGLSQVRNFNPDQARDAHGRFGSGGGQVEHLVAAAKTLGSDLWNRLPGRVRSSTVFAARVAKAAMYLSDTTLRVGKHLARLAAEERGLQPHQVERVVKIVNAIDQLSTLPVVGVYAHAGKVAAGSVVPGAHLIADKIPFAAASYVAYSTARNPVATYRAAKRLVQLGVGELRERGVRAFVTENLDQGLVRQLLDALGRHDHSDWYYAILSAALNEGQGRDVSGAIRDADAVYTLFPGSPDPDAADDDVEAVFEGGKSPTEDGDGLVGNTDDQPRDEKGRFTTMADQAVLDPEVAGAKTVMGGTLMDPKDYSRGYYKDFPAVYRGSQHGSAEGHHIYVTPDRELAEIHAGPGGKVEKYRLLPGAHVYPDPETFEEMEDHGDGKISGSNSLFGTRTAIVHTSHLGPYTQPKVRPVTPTTNAPLYDFPTDVDRLKVFRDWLRTQFKEVGLTDRELFEKYSQSAFRRGQARAFDDARAVERAKTYGNDKQLDFYEGTRDEFLRSAFARPVAIERIGHLAERSYSDMDGVTDEVETRMVRVLSDGLATGKSPRDVARNLDDVTDLGQDRSLLIARTEIVRAHAEGQLTGMEQLGVEEVGVAIEWSTTNDDRVCEECQPLEGVVLKIDEARGMLPRHPQCRCAWVPANVGEDQEDQKRSKGEVEGALEESGVDRQVDRDRPESALNRSFFADCERDERGHCLPGDGADRVSDAELRAVQRQARDKGKKTTPPTPEELAANQAGIAALGANKYRRNLVGNTADRRKRREALMKEFGDGKSCPCIYCGIKVGEGTLEQDKIYTTARGGRYRTDNLVPSCGPCNKQRGDVAWGKIKWPK